eukprot:g9643.t1
MTMKLKAGAFHPPTSGRGGGSSTVLRLLWAALAGPLLMGSTKTYITAVQGSAPPGRASEHQHDKGKGKGKVLLQAGSSFVDLSQAETVETGMGLFHNALVASAMAGNNEFTLHSTGSGPEGGVASSVTMVRQQGDHAGQNAFTLLSTGSGPEGGVASSSVTMARQQGDRDSQSNLGTLLGASSLQPARPRQPNEVLVKMQLLRPWSPVRTCCHSSPNLALHRMSCTRQGTIANNGRRWTLKDYLSQQPKVASAKR